ncbi:hypothetical protein OIDMADRAFT_172141 [Oidiodendron maius Zn]|uniref:Uncharacterized protein n=1 Tax=Oidiodendron maius (strain Zn) TaxID=913774 RepID=A0A0C3GFZ1_OIDMZ|nr:hypothetical protein OIDMADRAFT_172141 [Oidiodendron maius Zn]
MGNTSRDTSIRERQDSALFAKLDCSDTSYSVVRGVRQAIGALSEAAGHQIPAEINRHIKDVSLTNATDGSRVSFPCPLKEAEAIVALKAVEASAVAAIADIRFGAKERKIEVNLERAECFLFSAYLATIGGLWKQDPEVKSKLKDTDLFQAQSILYRRLAANLYATKIPGQYFHIHGSLEASTTLNMIGLEAFRPDLTDYQECIKTIESHVEKYSTTELEEMNARKHQAGVSVLKWEEFQQTSHGETLLSLPPWQVDKLEDSSPPAPFSTRSSASGLPQILSGIRVLELCRIVAGPAMGRTLAEYGAQVMKITSPNLSDVPFFQVDGNTGKHTCDLDLKTPSGQKTFEELIQTADVILDGYRPGSLERLGYGPQQIVEMVKGRGRGIVYVSEDCFGFQGEWAARRGWQQIADCVTGVAWAQGQFMGLDEPVVPPFPMSDYGTGCMGAIAALTGLYRRATEGGSWVGRTSLCQYDVFLLQLGLYDKDIQERIRQEHDEAFFQLRHSDSVDEVGKRALNSMKRVHPELFKEEFMQKAWSRAYKEDITWCRSPVSVEGVRVGFERASRPNGFDQPTWENWEVELEVVDG